MAGLRAIAVLALLVPAVLVGVPLQWLALKLRLPLAGWIPVLFHRWVNRVMGVRRIIRGRPTSLRPLLLVANHVSWLDISVLAAVQPLSFITKAEVGTWPLVGTFARLQRSVFVDRARRGRTAAVNAEIGARLRAGDAMLLFAEGTSSDGGRVLPFRTALLGAAQAAAGEGGVDKVWIQPLAITYVRHQGLLLSRNQRPAIAWYGDMDLLPHLWALLGQGAIDVMVSFGEPVEAAPDSDRKVLARQAEEEVRRLNLAALRG